MGNRFTGCVKFEERGNELAKRRMRRRISDLQSDSVAGDLELHRGTIALVDHLRPEMPEHRVGKSAGDRLAVVSVELRCDDGDRRA